MKLAPNLSAARRSFPENSRAAHYLKARRDYGPHMTAATAWEVAARKARVALTLESSWEAAKAALVAYWAELKAVEPKRYSKEGEELAALRKEERRAAASYFAAWSTGNPHYGPCAGHWQSAAGMYFCQYPDSTFRNVLTAEEVDRSNAGGFYSTPDMGSTVTPIVAQLSGRGGAARFVAGYRQDDMDGPGATFDLATVYTSHGEDSEEAQRKAARAAVKLAESNAEEEREYQTAAAAGYDWAELKAEEEEARRAALLVLKERRAARGLGNFPALCDAIRGTVKAARATIARNREKRAELAAGDNESLYFFPDERTKGAFCDAAGLESFPA